MFGRARSNEKPVGGSKGMRHRSTDRSTFRSRSAERPNSLVQRDSRISHARTARSSLLIDSGVQKAPDFRGERTANIKELLILLQQLKYPDMENLSLKVLQCPPSRTFLSIFQFLVDLVMPGYELPPRHEEVIPLIFKCCGYQWNISKSSLLSVTPHSWPQLCHALLVLAQGIQQLLSFFEPVELRDVVFVIDSIQNPSDPEVMKEKLKSSLTGPIMSNIEKFELLCKELEEDLNRLNQDCPEVKLDTLKTEVKSYVGKINTLKKYQSDSMSYVESKQGILDQRKTDIAHKMKVIEEQQSLCDELEFKYKTQEMTSAQVEELKSRKTKINESIKSLETAVNGDDEEIWCSEMKYNKCLKEVERLCQEFNKEVMFVFDEGDAEGMTLVPGVKPLGDFIDTTVLPSLMTKIEETENDEKVLELALLVKQHSDQHRQHQQELSAALGKQQEATQNSERVRAELKEQIQGLKFGIDKSITQFKELQSQDRSLKAEIAAKQEVYDAKKTEYFEKKNYHKEYETEHINELKALMDDVRQGGFNNYKCILELETEVDILETKLNRLLETNEFIKQLENVCPN